MSNPIVELADTFFNGRPAPNHARVVRVKLTQKHLDAMNAGVALTFTANGTVILVSLAKPKAGRA